MIITVTMNPAVDKTAQTATLVPGGLNRLTNIITDAGGKGINVSKMIKALGGDCIATGFWGGSTGRDIESILQDLQIKTDFVKISQTTRTNLKILSDDFGITEFNEPGGVITQCEMDNLAEKLISYAAPGVTFVFAGSLPRGVPVDVYRQLIIAVKQKGATAFLDADGEAFSTAVSAKPDYVKPNKFELLQYFGLDNDIPLTELANLCLQLVETGIGMVALSMGADGALFVTPHERLYAPGLKVNALSTVGAGDSMVGAIVYAAFCGMDLKNTAMLAMAASAGAVTTPGTKPPCKKTMDALIKEVKLQKI